jgi:hypothetical protein
MSFTKDTLKQAIQDYTENTETTFVSLLDTFIKSAEERILKTVQLDLFRKNVTGSVTSGTKFLAKPTDFLAPFSLSAKDVSFVQSYHPDESILDFPKYYSVFDVDNFILGPTPNENLTVELHYFYRPNSLTAGAGSGTTWLSTNAELTLLYGSLIEAYVFMKGEADILNLYDKRFQESLIGLKLLGESKENTQEYRVGRVNLPKQ